MVPSWPEDLSRYAPLVGGAEAYFAALSRPLPLTLWVNPVKTTVAALRGFFCEEGIQAEELSWYPVAFRVSGLERPGATLPFIAGWYYVQEEVAMTAVVALDPQPGERVVDLCASPGGKTAQAALRVGPSGLVVANEAHMGRLSALRATVDRLGLANVLTTWADGRYLPLPEGVWDRVLLDAPCSGEGTVRKSKGGYQPAPAPFRKALVAMQKQLLERALRLVKPNGVVVYSTCTFAPEENEEVLDAVLGDWGAVEPIPDLGLSAAPGLTSWQGRSFRQDLVHACRFWPHLNDTGGFFLARIRRSEEPFAPAKSPGKLAAKRPSFCPADPQPIGELWQRFAIPEELRARFRFWQRGKRMVWLAWPEAWPFFSVPLEGVGIPLLQQIGTGVKPKTHALQYLAPYVRANVVELPDREAARRFLSGQSQNLHAESASPGYVLVRFGRFALGCGLWARGQLHSQIPKALQLLPS